MTLAFVAVIILVNLIGFNVGNKRTVIVTGSNRGIGFATVQQLAATNDWQIVMATRSKTEADNAIQKIPAIYRDNVEFQELDLADLQSIRRFTSVWGKNRRPLDVLALNAGIQLTGTKTVQRTSQGFERTVGVNHIGHFLLVNDLLPSLERSVESFPRICFVGSGVHNPEEKGGDVGSKATLGDLSGLANGFTGSNVMVDGGAFDADKSYKDSKLCNVVTALELSKRLKLKRSRITCNVMNPGLIPTTGLFRDLNPVFVAIFTLLTRYVFKVAVSEEVGGQRLAYLIASPELEGITGQYFSGPPGQLDAFSAVETSKEARLPVTGTRLWTLTEQVIKQNS